MYFWATWLSLARHHWIEILIWKGTNSFCSLQTSIYCAQVTFWNYTASEMQASLSSTFVLALHVSVAGYQNSNFWLTTSQETGFAVVHWAMTPIVCVYLGTCWGLLQTDGSRETTTPHFFYVAMPVQWEESDVLKNRSVPNQEEVVVSGWKWKLYCYQ